MRITDLLDKRSISLTGAPRSKQEALDQMVDLMIQSGKINDREAYRQEVYRREEESTTGIGEGIAIPHGKGPFVDRPGLAAMVVKNGVDFDSSGRRAGPPDLPDRRTQYRRQCTSGCAEQALHAVNGRNLCRQPEKCVHRGRISPDRRHGRRRKTGPQ